MGYGVYFIQCGEGKGAPVKIGVTSDLEKRIESLQTGCPYILSCKALIPCHDKKQAFKLEKHLHNRFKKNRLTGEWFRLHGFNLKKILNEFSERESVPLVKQGLNVVRKTNKRALKLERENKQLKAKVLELERQLDEAYEIQIMTEANFI